MSQSTPPVPPFSNLPMPSEIVLPSGKFVTFRRPNLLDLLISIQSAATPGLPNNGQLVFLSRIATLEGVTLTPQQWMEMDGEDSWPAYATSVRIFEHLNKSAKGIA